MKVGKGGARVRAKESCWKGRERKTTRGGVWVGKGGGEESFRQSCFWGSSVCTASSRERWACLQDMGSEAGQHSIRD